MNKKNKIKIVVNGKLLTVNLKISLKNLIEKLKTPINKVAIELNKKILNKGDVVVAFSDVSPTDEVLGQSIFKVVHQKSKEEIYVALEDLDDA